MSSYGLADQIVRTDLKDLVDEDLFGAPYGMAPMGDDRKEMEGFRFWKTGQSTIFRGRVTHSTSADSVRLDVFLGYWKESLRGNPYHIR